MPAPTAPRLPSDGLAFPRCCEVFPVLDWKGDNKPGAGLRGQRGSRDLFHRHDAAPEQETWDSRRSVTRGCCGQDRTRLFAQTVPGSGQVRFPLAAYAVPPLRFT
jgi:hypothetical protein